MSTKQKIESLRFALNTPVTAGLMDNPRPIDEVLRVHLMTEALMEQIIRIMLKEHADAVVNAKLGYTQKLAICSNLKHADGSTVLSSDITGSLKKLNLLRNEVAHAIEHETTAEDAESLFVGQIGKSRNEEVRNGDVWLKLSSYKAAIFIAMTGGPEHT